jgi:hypothetical protein
MGSEPSLLDNWNLNGNRYINKWWKTCTDSLHSPHTCIRPMFLNRCTRCTEMIITWPPVMTLFINTVIKMTEYYICTVLWGVTCVSVILYGHYKDFPVVIYVIYLSTAAVGYILTFYFML